MGETNTNEILTASEASKFLKTFTNETGLIAAAKKRGFTAEDFYASIIEKIEHPDPKISMQAAKLFWSILGDLQTLHGLKARRTLERTKTDGHGNTYTDRVERDFLADYEAGEPPSGSRPSDQSDDPFEDPSTGGRHTGRRQLLPPPAVAPESGPLPDRRGHQVSTPAQGWEPDEEGEDLADSSDC